MNTEKDTENSTDIFSHTEDIFFTKRVSCSSHMLQLVVKDGRNEAGQLKAKSC